MKTKHDGDCTIYASLDNENPEDGICTCGYGHQRRGDESEMYSRELQEELRFRRMSFAEKAHVLLEEERSKK